MHLIDDTKQLYDRNTYLEFCWPVWSWCSVFKLTMLEYIKYWVVNVDWGRSGNRFACAKCVPEGFLDNTQILVSILNVEDKSVEEIKVNKVAKKRFRWKIFWKSKFLENFRKYGLFYVKTMKSSVYWNHRKPDQLQFNFVCI